MSKDELVAIEVEKWARTPFDPGQCCRGAGVDCKMLPAGIARDLGFPEAQSFYALTRDYDLSRKKDFPYGLLVEGFQSLFNLIPSRVEWTTHNVIVHGLKPGRLLLLKSGNKPIHVAIASRNEGHAWHAQIDPNPFVKEASLRSLLKIFPLHSVWAWRD